MRLTIRRVHVGFQRAALCALLALSGSTAHASSAGIAGYSGKSVTTCVSSGCHSANNDATVAIADPIDLGNPTLMYPGEARTFAISAARALNSGTQGAGIDIATSDGALSVAASESTTTKLSGTEIVHSSGHKNVTDGATVSYNFVYTMPTTALPADAARTIYGAAQIDRPGGGGNTTRALGVKLPAQPATLSLTPTATTIAVSWSGTTPAFRVLYKTGSFPTGVSDAGASVLYEGANTSATATNLNPSTQYFFSAFGKGGVAYSTLARQLSSTTNAVVASTYYVNGASGNDANAGTAGAPFKTVTHATTISAIGDIINVLPGTYNAALGEVYPLTIKSGVVLQSTAGAATTILDATGDNQRVIQGDNLNANTLIAGFTIKGGHVTDGPGFQTYGGGIFLDNTSNVTIRNNIFLNNTAKGYDGFSTSFPSGGGAFGGGIYVTGGNPQIFNNIFRNNAAIGGNGFNSPDGGSAGSGTYAAGGGIYVSGGSGLVVNNTFHGNAAQGGNGGTTSAATGGSGGDSQGGGAYFGAATARNNIISHNTSSGGAGGAGNSSPGATGTGSEGGATAFVTETNNLFFQNTLDDGEVGDNAVTGQDPLFANAAAGDFHLGALSPAKGAGISTNAPATDFEGVTRGNPPSIGAFEGGGAVSDTTAPTVSVTLPANSSSVKTIPSLTAVAADNAGGSGLKPLQFYLRHKKPDTSFEYWALRAGTWGWGAIASFPGAVNVAVTDGWIATTNKPAGTQLPTGVNLPDGQYGAYATATDNANNSKTSAVNSFVVDNTLPAAIAITAPVNLANVKVFTAASGTAADNAGGSGILKVEVTLRRTSDLMYWNGTAWAASIAQLPSVYSGSAWSKSTGFPAAGPDMNTQLVEGKYVLGASATDKAGNKGATVSCSFTVDRTVPPTLTLATPANGSAVKLLTPIAGAVADNAGGSGILKVDFTLRRTSDLKYWDGSAWAAVVTLLPTNLGAGVWNKNTGLPALGADVNTQLQDGKYTLTATAVDKAGNKSPAVVNLVTLDHTVPSAIAITTPANLANVKVFTAASGTAADSAGGSGILKVEVTLRRSSDLKYWDGTAWGATIAQLPSIYNGSAWNKNTGFPAAGTDTNTQLVEGKYVLGASATDKAGNKGATVSSTFTVDRTVPSATAITTPANLSSVKVFTAASGTAADNAGGSGILKVEVTLRRISDVKYWDGTAWIATATQLPTAFSGSAWTKNTGFPAAGTDVNTQLVEGKYVLSASATDKAGNKGAAATSTFTVDRTVPTVAIVAPANSDVVTGLTTLSGTAFDALSGPATINLVLKRASDNTYWNGTAWVATTTTLTTTATPTSGGNATWTYGGVSQPMPMGANLVNGSYSLTARSVDKAGNLSATAVSNFILALSGPLNAPVLATSPVQLSSIAASADGRVQLVFTGALKPSAAVETSRYSAGVPVESAATLGANAVVLGLDADAVHAGDRLTVNYNLLDANGLTLTGHASAVVK